MRPYGKVSITTLLMLAAVAAGIYALIVFSPVVADNFSVQEAVAIAYNQSGKYGDETLRNIIREKVRLVGTHEKDDGFGNLSEVMGLLLTDDQIVIDRNEPDGTIRIQVDYEREVEFKLVRQVVRLQFHPAKEGPIPR